MSPRQCYEAGPGGKGVGELTLPPICHGMAQAQRLMPFILTLPIPCHLWQLGKLPMGSWAQES